MLSLIAEGLTNREIGHRLGIAEKTVKNYVSGLLAKLGMERRTQAAVYGAEREAAQSPDESRSTGRSDPCAAADLGEESDAKAGEADHMNTLIVYESMFGNTRMIAEAVAEALRSTVTMSPCPSPPKPRRPRRIRSGRRRHADAAHADAAVVAARAVSWADDPDKKLKIEAAAQKPGIREWLDGIVVREPMPATPPPSTRADIPHLRR